MKLIYTPFILQAIVMGMDEFYLHKRRGLPRWERIGHPLDTLTTMAVYYFLWLIPYSDSRLGIAITLAAFSSFFITKDELVHTEKCSAFEHWLHALLFILHPTTFFCAGYLWMKGGDPLLAVQAVVVTVFFFYQVIRWSVPWQTPMK